MARASARLLAGLFALSAGGCSLLGLDEFDQQACADDCAAANRERGLDPQSECLAFRCNVDDGLCELRPPDEDGDGAFEAARCQGELPEAQIDCADGDDRRSSSKRETCDGIDNDCDSEVDEGEPPVSPTTLSERLEGVVAVTHLSHTVSADGTAYVAISYERDDDFGTLGLVLAEEINSDTLFSPDDHPLCAGPDPDTHEGCNFAQVAIAATGSVLVGVGINRSSCRDGQVRVGAGAASAVSARELTLELGAPEAGELARGIDVDRDAERWCTWSAECPGAVDPAIAVLAPAGDAQPAEALALWASPDDADDCANASTWAIAGIGLRVDGRSEAGLVAGSQGGHSEIVARGVGGPPAVVAWPGGADAGYIVGYTAGDALDLVHIARLGNADDSPLGPQVAARIDAEGARQLALAAGQAAPDGTRALAASWRTRGTQADAIVFAELSFERGTDPPFSVIGEPRVLERAAEVEVEQGPVLAHAAEGFIQADGQPAGGWFLAWIERETTTGERRLIGARIAQAEHRLLGDPFELARGELGQPFAYARDESVIRYGYVSRGEELELRVSGVTCPAR